MSRVIVLGNSHVAALRNAWAALPASERRHDLRFFAAHGPNFRKLGLTPTLQYGLSRRRVAAEPELAKWLKQVNGAPRIDLSRADLVVWGGYVWPLTPLARLMSRFDIDDLRDVGAPCRLSRPAFDAICADFVESRLPRERWRNWSGRKLALLLRPLPVEACAGSSSPVYSPWAAIQRRPAGARSVLEAFIRRFETAVADFGIEILRQPEETQVESGLTRIQYSRDFPGKPAEYNHMNADFGALGIQAILARADALT